MQFLPTVSHSMGAYTKALCLIAASSSSDDDETCEASPASDNVRVVRITSDSCSSAYVCIKREI